MAIDPGTRTETSLLSRIKGLLLDPEAEWPKIKTEPETIGSLYTGYIVPLAGFAVLCSLVSNLVGFTMLGVTYRPPVIEAVTSAIWQFGMQLAGVFISALVIDLLAPLFGGEKGRINALKLAAYSATAGWLANAFLLIPWLSFLSILGVYTLYLLYKGAPVLMKIPQARTLAFTASLVGISVVLAIIGFGLAATFTSSPEPSAVEESGSSGELSLPGAGRVDLGKLNELSKRLESVAQRGEGAPAALDAVALRALLPTSLSDGYSRTQISSSDSGVGIAMASATYEKEGARISLSVTDLGPAGAIAAITGALGASSNEETGDSYRRLATTDGRMTMEEYDTSARTGVYSFLVADRVMVKAEGSGPSIDVLKASAQAIDAGRIEALLAN